MKQIIKDPNWLINNTSTLTTNMITEKESVRKGELSFSFPYKNVQSSAAASMPPRSHFTHTHTHHIMYLLYHRRFQIASAGFSIICCLCELNVKDQLRAKRKISTPAVCLLIPNIYPSLTCEDAINIGKLSL
jgi:hypothetical protein